MQSQLDVLSPTTGLGQAGIIEEREGVGNQEKEGNRDA